MVPDSNLHGRNRLAATALVPLALALVLGALLLPTGGSAAAQATAPSNTGEPVISGQAEQGRRLAASTGTWTGTQPISFAYRWVRCGTDGGRPDGSNCPAIAGATTSRYVLTAADVGFRLRVRVTASNSAGSATVASNPTAVVVGRPVNTTLPVVRGSLVVGSVITADPGAWTGRQPISFSYRWIRCPTTGGSCVAIGATGRNYRLRAADVNNRMRFYVTARNAVGSTTVLSGESPVVTEPLPTGAVKLPSGETSIPATSVPATARLIVSQVVFSPNPVRSRQSSISVRVRVLDSRGFVVRQALVFVRSTPRVTSGGTQATALDGWVTFELQPRPSFPLENGHNVQFFVKAYRSGDPTLGGVAGYRLVQVATATS